MANFSELEIVEAPGFVMGKTNRTPEFLAKFPLGKVPAFEGSDGTLLVESDAIAQYVAESGPAVMQMLGFTPAQRASIRQWICFGTDEVMQSVTMLGLWRMGWMAYDESLETRNMQRLERALAALETQLHNRQWLVTDDRPSLADISVASGLVWGFATVIDAEMRQKYPAIMDWYKRVTADERVKRAFGETVYVEKRKEPRKEPQA